MDRSALMEMLQGVDDAELSDLLLTLPDADVENLLMDLGSNSTTEVPATPLAQAMELDPLYVSRPHLDYLSKRLAQAVEDVENGISRKLIVSMPPRHGKSHIGSIYMPIWLLRKHPEWKLMLVSHSPDLAASWGREVRRSIETNGPKFGVQIAPDAKAVRRWETTQRGVMRSLSVGQSPTGEGAKVLLVDDPVRNFETAHSEPARKTLWEWWQADMMLRLEPPSLTVVTMTRWHEDDLVGRLLSTDYDGDPDEWEQIIFPALAHEHDVLGREPGDPLLSPLIPNETREEALKRFEDLRRGMSAYQWSALFDQQPAPSQGAIFNVGDWRYWTSDPSRASEDGKVVYLDPARLADRRTRVLTSWDATFKKTQSSDYVVGQRWAMIDANRYLLDQSRDRRGFSETVEEMKRFATAGLGAALARRHLVEDKANGPAIIDTLKDKIAGIKPIEPRGSKEARARSVTPEIESGNVFLPHPSEADWVKDLIEEARVFPSGRHDDQVDALTQALDELRSPQAASLYSPNSQRRGAARQRGPASLRSALRGG